MNKDQAVAMVAAARLAFACATTDEARGEAFAALCGLTAHVEAELGLTHTIEVCREASLAGTHAVDVHGSEFADLPESDSAAYIAKMARQGARVAGSVLVISGHAAWTREQAIESARSGVRMIKTWREVCAEDNFISRAMRCG